MRTVPKLLSSGLLAMAAAIGLVAASVAGAAAAPRARQPGQGQRPLPRPLPGTGFGYGSRQLAGVYARQRPVPGTRHRQPVQRLHGHGGELGAHRGAQAGNFFAWSPVNAGQANTNYTKYGTGTGTGVYWYMGGPGVDPHWNGTTTEAYAWGKLQASWALA